MSYRFDYDSDNYIVRAKTFISDKIVHSTSSIYSHQSSAVILQYRPNRGPAKRDQSFHRRPYIPAYVGKGDSLGDNIIIIYLRNPAVRKKACQPSSSIAVTRLKIWATFKEHAYSFWQLYPFYTKCVEDVYSRSFNYQRRLHRTAASVTQPRPYAPLKPAKFSTAYRGNNAQIFTKRHCLLYTMSFATEEICNDFCDFNHENCSLYTTIPVTLIPVSLIYQVSCIRHSDRISLGTAVARAFCADFTPSAPTRQTGRHLPGHACSRATRRGRQRGRVSHATQIN